MQLLVSDVMAVIRHLGQEQATIVGHDWGGVVAWTFAFTHPQAVRNLVILNLPHPNGLAVQQDAAELVTSTMRWWLLARR
jgi:pimeloyl-ACP methyl ester carboxylesterase